MSSTPSLFTRFTDLFKPHRVEATIRLRNNGLGILSVFILTHFLPLPSLWTSIKVVSSNSAYGTSQWWWWWWWYLCAAELALLALLALNMLQSLYAIKYPRTPFPPRPSPARPQGMKPHPTKWPFSTISPTTSPQHQFQRSSSSSYASSPVSTPSRVLTYNTSSLSPSRFNSSYNPLRFSASLPPSPSPIISAYRGNHSISIGHALDGTLLSRLAAEESDSDD